MKAPMNQKKYVVCDIDGTIANLEHRLHFVFNEDGTRSGTRTPTGKASIKPAWATHPTRT